MKLQIFPYAHYYEALPSFLRIPEDHNRCSVDNKIVIFYFRLEFIFWKSFKKPFKVLEQEKFGLKSPNTPKELQKAMIILMITHNLSTGKTEDRSATAVGRRYKHTYIDWFEPTWEDFKKWNIVEV